MDSSLGPSPPGDMTLKKPVGELGLGPVPEPSADSPPLSEAKPGQAEPPSTPHELAEEAECLLLEFMGISLDR